MPRVLHVMHGLLLGGLERLVVDLAARSRRRGIDAMVVAVGADGRAPAGALLADGRGPVGALLEAEGVPHVAIAARGLSVEAVSGIVAAAHRFGADVLHAHDIGPWIVAVACASLLPGVSALGTFHTVKAPRGARRFAARVAAELSPVLVACGKEVARDLESWVPGRARIETIENGIEVGELPAPRQRAEARARMGVPPDAIVIGYLGRLFEEKAPDVLADAFERAFPGRPDVHVVFVGYGPMEEDLKRRASRDPRIHPLGRIMDGRALLAGLDVYAQPSKREGKSLALLEGMAAGLATVSSRLPAISEVHADGVSALLAEPGDVEAVADALRRLVDDPALRVRLGAAARARVEAHSAERMMDEYVELYEELVEEKRRPLAERLRRLA